MKKNAIIIPGQYLVRRKTSVESKSRPQKYFQQFFEE